MRLHHLAVVVADLPRAEAFYAGLLGLPVSRRGDDAQGQPRAVWVTLDDGSFLALERAGRADPRRDEEAPGFHCLALGIARDERASWQARLAAAGHPTVRETDYTFYVRDPDGNLVGLSHYPEPRG